MALNYYVPTKMTSAELTQTPAADAPADSAPPQVVANSQLTPGDLLEHLLEPHVPDTLALCIPIARPADPFVGRGELLAALLERLLGAPGARLALDGPPGVGKTRLALEIAYDERIRRHFGGGVLMMGLGQYPDVELHLRGWAAALGLEHDPRLSTAAQVERIAARIDGRRQPCLLIVDDVWKAEQCAFLPSGPFVAALITGRQRESTEFAALVGEDSLVAVPPLDQDEAIELLRERSGRPSPDDIDELAALAALAGGSPLLLALIGSYLHQQHQDHEDWFVQTLDDLDRSPPSRSSRPGSISRRGSSRGCATGR